MIRSALAIFAALLATYASCLSAQGNLKPGSGWTAREIHLGTAGSIAKWCGDDGLKILVSLQAGPAVVDSISGAVKVAEGIRPELPAICSQDGNWAFVTESRTKTLLAIDTNTLNAEVLHRSTGTANAVSPRVSPKLTYMVGGQSAPESLSLSNGVRVKVVRPRMSPSDLRLFSERGAWSNDERYFFWLRFDESTLHYHEPIAGKTGKRSIVVAEFTPWWLAVNPQASKELFVYFGSVGTHTGREYRVPFLSSTAKPALLIDDIVSHGPDRASANGSIVFVRNHYPSNSRGTESSSPLPVSSEIQIFRAGQVESVAFLEQGVLQQPQPAISSDGKRIAYIANSAKSQSPAESTGRRLVILERIRK
jgi:hypothetical protein